MQIQKIIFGEKQQKYMVSKFTHITKFPCIVSYPNYDTELYIR